LTVSRSHGVEDCLDELDSPELNSFKIKVANCGSNQKMKRLEKF
jgi:hypothetical protein